MKKLNNKKGFTIVELVIVIAVIGILAGVLIPTFSGIQQSAKESAAFQECKNVLSSVLALNEGAIPAKTLFSVNSDKDASTIEYNFIYENQKLGNNTEDVTSNRAALNLSSDASKKEYKIYVSATAVKDFLNDDGVLIPNDDNKDSNNNFTTYATSKKLTEDAISMIKAVLNVDLEGATYSNDSGNLKITKDQTTITCYYTSDIKSSIVVFLANPKTTNNGGNAGQDGN